MAHFNPSNRRNISGIMHQRERYRTQFMNAFEAAAVATCPALAGRVSWADAIHYWHASGYQPDKGTACGIRYANNVST